MRATKLFKHISILVIILVIPGFLYYLLQAKGKNRYKPLPFFGVKKLSGSFHSVRGKKISDTLYYEVKPTTLINLKSEPVLNPFRSRKITIVQFFYSHDKILVPKMTAAMSRLAKAYEKNDLIQFVSVTVDPDRDTPQALAKYAVQYGGGNSKWRFYTGNQDSILILAQRRLLVNAAKLPTEGKFIFSDKVVLLDPLKRIRGFYQIAQPKEEVRLNDELKVQVAEELRKIKGAQ